MPEEVPFQIVTRAARRRNLEEEPAQSSSANAPPADDSSNDAPQGTPKRRTAPSSTISRPRRRTPSSPAIGGRPRRGATASLVNKLLLIPLGQPTAPVLETPADDAMVVDDTGLADFMAWVRANFPRTTPNDEDVSMSSGSMLPPTRCTSPSCPVPSTIPHYLGLYLHDGEPSSGLRFLQGPSNPPPDVWRMFTRLCVRTERPGDREAVGSFLRNHYIQPH